MPAVQLTSYEEAQFSGPPGNPPCSRKPLLPWAELRRGLPIGLDWLSIASAANTLLPWAELRRATPTGFDWMGIASATNPLLPWAELRGATPAGFDWLSIGSAAGLLLPQEMPGGPQATPRERTMMKEGEWGTLSKWGSGGGPGRRRGVVLHGAVPWPWGG